MACPAPNQSTTASHRQKCISQNGPTPHHQAQHTRNTTHEREHTPHTTKHQHTAHSNNGLPLHTTTHSQHTPFNTNAKHAKHAKHANHARHAKHKTTTSNHAATTNSQQQQPQQHHNNNNNITKERQHATHSACWFSLVPVLGN